MYEDSITLMEQKGFKLFFGLRTVTVSKEERKYNASSSEPTKDVSVAEIQQDADVSKLLIGNLVIEEGGTR